MLVDVSELMNDDDFAQPFVVKRPTTTLANHGVASTAYREINLIGIVQPATAQEIAMLPEGERSSEIMNFWCTQELFPGDGKEITGDIAIFGGTKYVVIKSTRWGDVGSGYFKSTAKAVTL
jgi:hypothetical protein